MEPRIGRFHFVRMVIGIGERLEPGQLPIDLREPFLQLFGLGEALLGIGSRERSFSMLHAGEHRLDRVIILLGDGIEFVIVATGASDGEA